MDLLKQSYISAAAGLNMGDFTKVKPGATRVKLINKMADGYCLAKDTNDDEKKNQYISALMLLFYGEISKIANKCKYVGGYEYEDYAYVLFNCIDVACQYRAWKNNTKINAEQCIRQSIASRGAAALLYDSNLDKGKANANLVSLDTPVKNTDDLDTTIGDLMSDSDENDNFMAELNAKSLIQLMIDKNKIVESIILDSIAFGDSSVKTTKEKKVEVDTDGNEYSYQSIDNSFWTYKLVQNLAQLPEGYAKYFKSQYDIDNVNLNAAISRIRASNNQKLYKMVRICLAGCKTQFKN